MLKEGFGTANGTDLSVKAGEDVAVYESLRVEQERHDFSDQEMETIFEEILSGSI
ncbi:hypothetical protein [uncultured Dysosmobacter sp.]|uniref:hypothetical protein n=1 Tax=uncultured Dysosmobacter sp. TaxID=2591384 RepID=UPI00262FC7D3|nr:hypothetical protein [uncultured Dysosmobacter sp.]